MITSIEEVERLAECFYNKTFGELPAPRPDVAVMIKRMCAVSYVEGWIDACKEMCCDSNGNEIECESTP